MRLLLDAFQQGCILTIAPESEAQIKLMVRTAASWDMRKQKFHSFDVISGPASKSAAELVGWTQHGLRSELVDALFKIVG